MEKTNFKERRAWIAAVWRHRKKARRSARQQKRGLERGVGYYTQTPFWRCVQVTLALLFAREITEPDSGNMPEYALAWRNTQHCEHHEWGAYKAWDALYYMPGLRFAWCSEDSCP